MKLLVKPINSYQNWNFRNNIIWKIIKLLFLYPVSVNLNYWWNYGVLALFCLSIQIITGIFLAMYYSTDSTLAFESIEYIMRNINYGWLLRYSHSNGASFFFLVVYIHIFRNLFYHNFLKPRHKVWATGVIILFLMILTAFLGYVLPWGQMSFWAATVITNLSSAIPFFGSIIVIWIWGGYAIDNATLNRFFSFHFVLPFIICFIVFLHILFLHEVHSGSPDTILSFLKRFSLIENVGFYPYYIIKDMLGIQIFFLFFFFIIFFFPNLMGHTDNYIPANPLVTPTHIVPEWYFLSFYAILRSIPNKLIGVISLVFSIFILFILPWLLSNLIKGSIFSKNNIFIFWIFSGCILILGWIGQKSVEIEFLFAGRVTGFIYFIYFFIFLELLIYLHHFFLKIFIYDKSGDFTLKNTIRWCKKNLKKLKSILIKRYWEIPNTRNNKIK